MDVGVTGSAKKKLTRSTWAGHVERMGDEKLAKSRCPYGGGEMEERKTEIAKGGFIKSDLEILGEEWRKRATDRRNWRLLTEK